MVDGSMRILVNGESREFPDGLTLAELLDELGIRRDYTAVALNREVAAKASYVTTMVREGDRLEIVRPMAGG